MMAVRPDPERSIYLVDGTNNLFRAFHAIPRLTNSKGFPTNAVLGFTTMLRKLLREHAPRYAGVAFDLAEPTFRHKAYADYKANRPEAPPDLVAQIPAVRKVCQVLGVPSVDLPGYEADDLIGTLARGGSEAGFEVVIVTTDKDLLQLVGERVRIFNPRTEEFLDATGVETTFGVKPSQVRDVLALWGDESDNIPGVPGIGEKGAKKLIREFGDLEGVLAAAPTLKSAPQRQGLETHAETARLSRDLATVDVNVPIPFDPDLLRLRPPDERAALELFQDLEFNSLAREFASPAAARVEAPQASRTILKDAESLERAVSRLRSQRVFAVHVEADRPEPMQASLVGVALAGAGEAFYLPLGHHEAGEPSRLGADSALRLLRPLLEDPGMERVGDDVKTDLVVLRRLGIAIPGLAFDTMLASYLLNPSRRHALEAVATELAGLEVPAYESLLGSGAKRVPISHIDAERAAALVCPRASAMLALRGRLEAALEHDGLLPLLRDLELPLTSVLADMEIAGVRIDAGFLAPLSVSWGETMARLTAEIHALAGREFNLNSPRQLGEVLFETLKLQPGRKTQKTRSFSTGVDVLEELAASHELPRRILEYRTLQKLKSTYVDALPRLVDPGTGRVHTSFNQAVAATGRLSSSDPNLQNIPVRTEQGQQIRRAFVPADGCLLLSADYSQIELRILAHLCADPALVAAFRAGEDIHRRTAAEIFGVHPHLVTDEMRRRAKAVNFGILYGMGPQRLARDQGIPLKEAQQFIERYFQRLPAVKQYLDEAIAAVEREGKVRTLFGRVRYFPEIRGTDRNLRQQAIRAAVNTAIQGTAADLIKMAMVALAARLRTGGSGARMTLQVHDELVLEVPEREVASTAAVVRQVMEGVHPLAVPLAVDLRAGRNWLDLEDLGESKD
jgi:DNA polymerase-1